MTLLDEKIAPYVREICQRDPYSGKVVTGGIVTVRDSAWLMSWTFNRQPHFKAQPKTSWWAGSTASIPTVRATMRASP